MSGIFDKIGSLWSLLVGLKITGREFTRPQITVHYPRRAVDTLPTYRGHIELVGKPKQPEVPRCITCMLCASVCPSSCIRIKKAKPPPPEKAAPTPPAHANGPLVEPERAPPPKKKVVKTPGVFTLDYTLCSLCGLCVQSCPVDALRFSTDVYLAGFTREEFHYDLMARLKAQAEALGVAAAEVKAPAGTDPLPPARSEEDQTPEPEPEEVG